MNSVLIEFLKTWILNIVTLAVFIVLLEILLPSGRTKKFVNLISGFILLIAIINPFLSFYKKGVDLESFQIISSNMLDKKQIEENSKVLKEKQMKQITEVYRGKIIKQVEECANEISGGLGTKAEVLLNEDYKSNNFGEIKRVYIYISMNEKSSDIKPVTQIKKVEIGKKKNNEVAMENSEEVDEVMKKKIEAKITALLGVNEENIVISLKKEG